MFRHLLSVDSVSQKTEACGGPVGGLKTDLAPGPTDFARVFRDKHRYIAFDDSDPVGFRWTPRSS